MSELDEDGQQDPDLVPGIFSRDGVMIGTEDYDLYENDSNEESSKVGSELTDDNVSDLQEAAPLKQVEKDDENNWKEESSDVDFEDDTKPQQSAGRYFSDIINVGPTCHNCGKTGHIARECGEASNQPCFLCGQLGHNRNECPNDLCYNCLRPGHQSRDCMQPKRRRFLGDKEVCNRCGLPGHLQRDCSLSWRQYVFKKELNRHQFNKAVSSLHLSCYYCASAKHFGDECPDRLKGGFSIFHRPSFAYVELVAYRISNDVHSSHTHRRSLSPGKRSTNFHRNMTLDNRQSSRSPTRRDRNAERDFRGSTSSHHHHQHNRNPNQQRHRPMYRGGYGGNKAND